MRWGSGCVAVLAVVCGAVSAWPSDSAYAQSLPESGSETFLWFAGADLWRAGGFAHGGLVWSPGGVISISGHGLGLRVQNAANSAAASLGRMTMFACW